MPKSTSFNDETKRLLKLCQLLAPLICFFWSSVSFSNDQVEKVQPQPKQVMQAEAPESTEKKPCCKQTEASESTEKKPCCQTTEKGKKAESQESTGKKPCCPPEKKGKEEEPKVATVSNMTIPDVELLDQDGKKVRFYSDLVKGKLVAMNFIFTTSL